MQGLLIEPGSLPPECEALRADVRSFLAEAMTDVPRLRRNRSWSGASAEFSRRLGERGWIMYLEVIFSHILLLCDIIKSAFRRDKQD